MALERELVEKTQIFASREYLRHTLVVNTQTFPCQENQACACEKKLSCFAKASHALVVNTQAFPSRVCLKHALVENTQPFYLESVSSITCGEHISVLVSESV